MKRASYSWTRLGVNTLTVAIQARATQNSRKNGLLVSSQSRLTAAGSRWARAAVDRATAGLAATLSGGAITGLISPP